MFVNKPTIVFKRNKNIQDLIGSHLIKDGEVPTKKLEKWKGKSKACNTARPVHSKVTKQREFSTYIIPLRAKVNELSTY